MVSQAQKVRMDGQVVGLSYMAVAFSSRSGGRRQQNGDAESAVSRPGGFGRGRGMRCGKLCYGLAVVDLKGMHGESGSGKSTAGSDGGTGLRAVADSIVIVAFFAAGILCGLYGLLPFDVTETGIAVYALYALIFVVGFSIGNSPDVIGSFRRLSPGLALLPLCTVIGTLAVSALMGLLLPHRSVQETMAVGSGFAYYSLSSIIITEYKGAELGTVALVANIVREFITLLAAPLLARWFGPLAPIAAGGATTADVTLPIITNTCGERYAVLSMNGMPSCPYIMGS